MKTYSLNIRIDEETNEQLQIISDCLNISKSVLARSAINDYLHNQNSQKEDHQKWGNEANKLLQSLGFTELIFWLYEKARNPEVSEIDELYVNFIELISELIKQGFLKPEIQSELSKVSDELKQVLNNKGFSKSYFEFVDSFDYEVLADFMYTLRYDEDNNRVIHIK